ncbi:exodeoxyribonuclease V subunit beta [Pelomonas sp. KK5]|uniref:exodeoxyribonuclease V subunit beta n=1 Tax=Pelomonas sp. KK5 TaxID=1855730 RepID=UPI0035122B28
MNKALDALSFPLWGSRLIEASAGTGKTWTIAALYLRLVLGHGGDEAGFHRPLAPAEILVMTFTRAATRELSDRIRARLLEAARVFRGEAEPEAHDALLRGLLADHEGDEAARSQAAWRLAVAAESMDDAAVFTIDAWCQRMLREHAFDSGCLFDEELLANENGLVDEAVRDYWRQQVYPLAGEALDTVLAVWGSVDKLGQDARALLAYLEDGEAPADEPLGARVGRINAERSAALGQLKAGWPERIAVLLAWHEQRYDLPKSPFNKTKLRRDYFQGWMAALSAWAADPLLERPELSDKAIARLCPAGMAEALKAGEPVPAECEAFEALSHALDALPPLAEPLRRHAARHIAERLALLKSRSGSFGFHDMLQRLDRALDADTPGERAERLRARMLAQYPVALIDEFQDTSPLQTRIFDRLYRIEENARERTLLLIGDPKQSIYAFRGADIHSYLSVREATEGRHYMLGTNHRSTQALVAAVNAVFELPEQRAEGEGAFMFRRADGSNPLPFEPVLARGRAERFVSSAGDEPAIRWALAPQLQEARLSQRRLAAACAEQITTLLNDESAGFASAEFRRLRPADIAVLVRTGREAAAVRRELRRRGVAAVYLSEKDSVFASAEARDILLLLRAVAAPLDVRLARAALASATLGLSLAELERLAREDEAFERRSEQLRALHTVWQAQGVLTMLRRALHLLELPARWLGGDADGERRMTNWLHLAELLQQASTQLDGEQALIRWLRSQRELAVTGGGASGGDEQIVRLESDADLVKLVTVHKSKGLEYPLVFLPFACSYRAVAKRANPVVPLVDADGQRRVHLTLDATLLEAADRDRQREDLRLLYVALTRARHALWIGVAALKRPLSRGEECTAAGSALGHVLGRPDTAEALMNAVRALAASQVGMVAGELPLNFAVSSLLPRGSAVPLREPQAYHGRFERRWAISSFSSLVRALEGPVSTAVARDDEDLLLMPPAQAPRRPVAEAEASPWHRFPRGAQPGNFLHDQFEWLAGESFALADSPALQEQLQARCERQGHGERAEDVKAWLLAALRTPLPPLGIPLAEVGTPLAEMEFWLPGTGLRAQVLDALCRQHLLPAIERRPLAERELRGMLMGFADLVFEHEGRYWVLDYKSNALGEDDAAYDAGALAEAMAEHRYDVQAAIYLLALHRLLRTRLPGYEPARHLGGALYFFFRGINGPAAGCHAIAPPLELLQSLDALIEREDTLA